MRTLTIPEIKALDNKDAVPAVEGTIKKVFEQKKGEGDYGPWFLQNFILTDGEHEIAMTWDEEDKFDLWEGKRARFESTEGKKGKQGLKWEVRHAGGKTYESVKVDGRSKITELKGETTNGRGRTSHQEAERPKAKETTVELDETDIIKAVRRRLMQTVNGFMLVERAVKAQVDAAKNEGIDCTPDNFGGKCGSAYRELNGLIQKLPDDHPIWTEKKELPKEVIHEVFRTREKVQGAMNSAPGFEEEIPF